MNNIAFINFWDFSGIFGENYRFAPSGLIGENSPELRYLDYFLKNFFILTFLNIYPNFLVKNITTDIFS